jgi:hypothetical protein
MNKFLMMSAAAVLASSTAAIASEDSKGGFNGTISFGSGCDYFDVNYFGQNIYTAEHVFSACNGTTGSVTDFGVVGKYKKASTLNFGDDIFAILYGENVAALYQFSTPIKTGGTWDLWVAFSASSVILGNEGNYVVRNGDSARRSGPSTISNVVEMLRQRGVELKRAK